MKNGENGTQLFLTKKTDAGNKNGSAPGLQQAQDQRRKHGQQRGRLCRSGSRLWYVPPRNNISYRLCWSPLSNLSGTRYRAPQ